MISDGGGGTGEKAIRRVSTTPIIDAIADTT
jgi:hypothetical protein